MAQSASLPVSVPAPALEPEPPEPALGAVLAPLALGHSPVLSQGVIAVLQAYSVVRNSHSPSVGDASHVPSPG